MQDQSVDKVLDALRELAGVAGKTAETLWPMAVQATWAESLAILLSGLLASVVAVVAAALVWRISSTFNDEEARSMCRTLSFVIAALTVGLAVPFCVAKSLPGLLSPEGVTLMKILG